MASLTPAQSCAPGVETTMRVQSPGSMAGSHESTGEIGSSVHGAGSEAVHSKDASWLGRLLPWVVSLGVLAWVLWPYRAAGGRAVLLDAFGRASGWIFTVTIVGTLAIWLTDSYATARTLQRWGTQIGLRETCLIRGTTALFDAVNPALGQAVLTLVVHRRGMPLPQTLVIVLLMNLVFVVLIALISGAGLAAGATPRTEFLPAAVLLALGLTAIYLVLVGMRVHRTGAGRAALRRVPTLSWLMDAGLSGHAWALMYRVPNMAVLIVSQVLYLRCFGIELPLSVALFYLPAVMFIVGMPLSVQGLGPGQVASVAFFAAYAGTEPAVAEATVIASSLARTALMTLGALLIGLCCATSATGRRSLAALRTATPR